MTGIGSIAENTTVTATGETQDPTAREPAHKPVQKTARELVHKPARRPAHKTAGRPVRESGIRLPNGRRDAVFRMDPAPIEGGHPSGSSLAPTRPVPEN